MADRVADHGRLRRLSVRRMSLPFVGGVATAVVLALATLPGSAGLPGSAVLGTVLLLAQVLLVAAVLSLLDAPARGWTSLFGSLVAVAADLAVLVRNPDGAVGRLAGVVGLALVAALLLQLARRERSAVTESLTDSLLVVVLVCATACLLALRQRGEGDKALLVAFCAAGVALLIGRVADRQWPGPRLRTALDRGWPGLLLALAAGSLIGTAVGAISGLSAGTAGWLASAAAATACVADLIVGLSAIAMTPAAAPPVGAPPDHATPPTMTPAGAPPAGAGRVGQRRRLAALRPVGALLPYALLGPVVLVVSRLTMP